MTLALRPQSGLDLPVRIHAAIAGMMVAALAVTLCLWALNARTLAGAFAFIGLQFRSLAHVLQIPGLAIWLPDATGW